MNVLYHGVEEPNLQVLISTYSLPWDMYSVRTENLRDLLFLKQSPELLTFTIQRGRSISDLGIERLKSIYPKSHFFCLSLNHSLFLAEDLAHSGINGFAEINNLEMEDFLSRLKEIKLGKTTFPTQQKIQLEGLSIKELLTIRHIASGLTAKQMGYLHNVSENSIKKRKQFIMERLDKHTTEEISAWAAHRMNIPKRETIIKNGDPLINLFLS